MSIEKKPTVAEAEYVLKATLEAFSTKEVGFMKRWDSQRVMNIAAVPARPRGKKGQVLWWYPITFIGQTWKVIIYREDGDSFNHARYGIIDEIHTAYQHVSISQLISFLQNPPRTLDVTLAAVLRAANEASKRVLATGRSLDAE
jgi:hypothetical protein